MPTSLNTVELILSGVFEGSAASVSVRLSTPNYR